MNLLMFSCKHTFCRSCLREHSNFYLGNKLIYSPQDPEGERQLKCPEQFCCNNITEHLADIWDEKTMNKKNELAAQRFSTLIEKYHPEPIPDPKNPFQCMLCLDDFKVITLHGTHTYCRGCLNGWAILEADSNEDNLRIQIFKKKKKCPFVNCAEFLNPGVSAQINTKMFAQETKQVRANCSICELPKRSLKSIGQHACKNFVLACLTCWRKSWENNKQLQCFTCSTKAPRGDEQEMIMFMSSINSEMTFEKCEACQEVCLLYTSPSPRDS